MSEFHNMPADDAASSERQYHRSRLMSAALTPEQTRALAVLDAVREAIATGQEMEVTTNESGFWGPASIETAITLRAHEDFKFRIKPKPEVVRLRVGIARRSDGSLYKASVRDEEEANRFISVVTSAGYAFLGWAGPWQEVDVSTLTKD